jgi:hypothetical protein
MSRPATVESEPAAAVAFLDFLGQPDGEGTFSVADFLIREDDFVVGGLLEATLFALAFNINGDTLSARCTAVSDGVSRITLTANEAGSAGNDIPIVTDDPNIVATPFSGGSD